VHRGALGLRRRAGRAALRRLRAGGDVVVTDVAPPAPYYETVPALPFAGAVWLDGYWGWHGGRHVWVGGRYDHGRPGYSWQPHRWTQRDGRWHLQEGRWARR
jgi:hypothetical protein